MHALGRHLNGRARVNKFKKRRVGVRMRGTKGKLSLQDLTHVWKRVIRGGGRRGGYESENENEETRTRIIWGGGRGRFALTR